MRATAPRVRSCGSAIFPCDRVIRITVKGAFPNHHSPTTNVSDRNRTIIRAGANGRSTRGRSRGRWIQPAMRYGSQTWRDDLQQVREVSSVCHRTALHTLAGRETTEIPAARGAETTSLQAEGIRQVPRIRSRGHSAHRQSVRRSGRDHLSNTGCMLQLQRRFRVQRIDGVSRRIALPRRYSWKQPRHALACNTEVVSRSKRSDHRERDRCAITPSQRFDGCVVQCSPEGPCSPVDSTRIRVRRTQ